MWQGWVRKEAVQFPRGAASYFVEMVRPCRVDRGCDGLGGRHAAVHDMSKLALGRELGPNGGFRGLTCRD